MQWKYVGGLMMRLWALSFAIVSLLAPMTVEGQKKASPRRTVADKLSAADTAAAAALFNMKVVGGRIIDECDGQAGGPVAKDLNQDGRLEAIFYDGMCLGGMAGFVGIAARKVGGGWKVIFADQGVLDILPNRRSGWPDLRLGKPGMGPTPTYHWLGSRYNYPTDTPDDTPLASNVPIVRGTSGKVAAVKPSAPAIAPTPTVSFQDPSISLCTNKSGADCDLIIGPAFTTYMDPACQYGNMPIQTCADNAIRLAEAKSATEFYLVYFEQSAPRVTSGGVMPLDRFYRAIYLQRNKKGVWRTKGMSSLTGLLHCPDYALSSLHMRRVIGVPQETNVARFVRCDITNRGEFTYRDPALVADPPFFRPSGSAMASNGPIAERPTPDTLLAAGEGASSVWALGRVRMLVERGSRCGSDENLGKSFCFGEAITWLKRHPDKSEVDVIAMNDAYVPGSMIPYDNGRGWQVFRVARAGTNFTADTQRHFATKVQVPQGCPYRGVRQDAWYITVSRGRRVAVEAKLYSCAYWRGDSIYATGADYSFIDSNGLDYLGTAQDYQLRNSPSNADAGSGTANENFYNNATLRAMIARRRAEMPTVAASNKAFNELVGSDQKSTPRCVADEAMAGLALINGSNNTHVCKPANKSPRRKR